MIRQDTSMNPVAKRDILDQMVDALRRKLMNPRYQEDETDPSEEFPTARYIVGRLAPQDLKIDDVENEALPTGDDDGETGEASFEPPPGPWLHAFFDGPLLRTQRLLRNSRTEQHSNYG